MAWGGPMYLGSGGSFYSETAFAHPTVDDALDTSFGILGTGFEYAV